MIQGGKPLAGTVRISPAKNAALPILAASLLTPEPVVLEEVPRLRDIEVMLELLAHLGTRYVWEGRRLYLETPEIVRTDAPYELVAKMRASFIVLGALLARAGEGRVSKPGGCAFGPRPVDQHLKALRKIGARLEEDAGAFRAERVRPLRGRVVFDVPTVGGTEQVLLATALGDAEVTIVNAAQEPEIVDLARFLTQMGATIVGAGTSFIHVRGAARLKGVRGYRIIPDRIEAGTYLLAAAATRGQIRLLNVEPNHLDALLDKLGEAGHRILVEEQTIHFQATETPRPFNVEAREYPGFPTDLQPIATAYLATVPGTSRVSDRVYPMRFSYVDELKRLGAEIKAERQPLAIEGRKLLGTEVEAPDIRAGGALVVAALAAEGQSRISGTHHLKRGYENLVEKLRGLGAEVAWAKVPVQDAAD